jgi:histone H3/H4
MAKKKKSKKPAFTFIVKSAVQEFAKKKKMMVGSDSYDALNLKVEALLKAAAGRTKSNGRKTLKAYDL